MAKTYKQVILNTMHWDAASDRVENSPTSREILFNSDVGGNILFARLFGLQMIIRTAI